MKTVAWLVCGCIIFLSGFVLADDYWTERQALDNEIGQAIAAQELSRALMLIDKGLAADKQAFKADHPISLERLKAKQSIHLHLEQKELADATTERIRTLWQTVLGTSSDPATLETLGDYAQGENASKLAITAFKKALAIREAEANDPQSSLTLASTLYRLANALFTENFEQLDKESLGYLQKAIKLRETTQSPEHHDLVPLLKLITKDRSQSTSMAEVEKLHKKIIRIEERAHPATHNSVLKAHLGLAKFYLNAQQADATLAVTQPYLKTPDNPSIITSDFGLYTIQALLLQRKTKEAADLLYKRLALYMEQVPKESYEQLFQVQLSQLEEFGRNRNVLSADIWDALANDVHTLERNATIGFPYLSFFLRHFSTGKLENKDARQYLSSLEKLVEISNDHLPTNEPLALDWIESALGQTAKYYPEKSATLARQLEAGYQRQGDRVRSARLQEAANQYDQQARANQARSDALINYMLNSEQ